MVTTAFSSETAQQATERHLARVRRILVTCHAWLVGMGLIWFTFFALRGDVAFMILNGLMIPCGLLGLYITRHGRVRAASMLFCFVLWFTLSVIALYYDIPTPAAPRSVHFYLLPLGVACLVLLRYAHPWLRHGCTVFSMLLFVVLASMPFGLDTRFALPDSVRVSGTWVNTISAMLLLYAVVRILLTDQREDHGLMPALRKALKRRQFELHYQPQVRVDGSVYSAEALLRWKHPSQGYVSPGVFIPLAEQSGLILPLGDWVLQEGCMQLGRWAHLPHMAPLAVAVNVSAEQFRQADYLSRVQGALQRSGARPELLKIELTESMLAEDLDGLIAKMHELRGMGLRISLDDFGTGFSSLSYLKHLPLDQLKLDQSFVREVLDDPNDAAIVRSVIDLGLSLGLEIIAEGVEMAAQRDCLAAMGCPAFQGYLFSRPLPVAEFERYVLRQTTVLRRPDGFHPLAAPLPS